MHLSDQEHNTILSAVIFHDPAAQTWLSDSCYDVPGAMETPLRSSS